MKVELNKKYRYRNGEPARVLCVDAPGVYPIISIAPKGQVCKHAINGSLESNTTTQEYGFDLIEVREPLECWVRVLDNGSVDFGSRVGNAQDGTRRLFREVIE